MTTFKSRISLGKLYKEIRSGLEGYANCVIFQPHGCIEIQLEYMKDGKPERFVANELRLVTPNGAELTEEHTYETDLVQGHEYEDVETGIKGHLAIVEFHEFMATRGCLRMVGTDNKGFQTIKYLSIDDFLLKDLSTDKVAQPKTEKRSPATHETDRYDR